ncbi:MAG: DUF3784 domain-containing protein [Roseburia sp.]
MIGAVIVGLIGIVFVVLGYLLWKKERISLLHEYHYDKVSKEDKKAFCTISGTGIIIIGIGLLITGVMIGITNSAWSFIAFAIGFFAGLAMLIYAGVRYNH